MEFPAEFRSRLQSAGDQVCALQRETRRRPVHQGVQRSLAPGIIGIEQRGIARRIPSMGIGGVARDGDAAAQDAIAHGFPLLAGQFQTRADIGGRFHAGRQQREQAAQRSGGDGVRLFPLDQPIEQRHVRYLGQHRREDAAAEHRAYGETRIVQPQQLEQFVGNAFARQPFQAARRRLARGIGFPVHFAAPEPREETKIAQDAQMILGNALRGIANEAQTLCLQIGQTAEIVGNLARLRIRIERIDREIAPRRIFPPVVRKGHGGAAAVGGNIAPQGRDFERAPIGYGGDRAVIDAGGHRFEARRLEPPHHLFGPKRRGHIDIVHGAPQKAVAHRAADDPGPHLAIAQCGNHGDQGRIAAPRGIGQFHAASRKRRDRLAMIPAVTPQMRRPCQSIS